MIYWYVQSNVLNFFFIWTIGPHSVIVTMLDSRLEVSEFELTIKFALGRIMMGQ